MLELIVPGCEEWDEINQEFLNSKDEKLVLEHSLISLSKWEAKWEKPFLSQKDKTTEEVLDYIRCMTVNKNVSPDVYRRIPANQIDQINRYISLPMTATTFSEAGKKVPGPLASEFITSEIIYYWMIQWGIPFECEKWNLNRLLTLIRVCSVKSQKTKKMSPDQVRRMYADLNAKRRKALNSSG